MNAIEFKLVLEKLASSGGSGLTVADMLERIQESGEDLRTVTPGRAVLPSVFAA